MQMLQNAFNFEYLRAFTLKGVENNYFIFIDRPQNTEKNFLERSWKFSYWKEEIKEKIRFHIKISTIFVNEKGEIQRQQQKRLPPDISKNYYFENLLFGWIIDNKMDQASSILMICLLVTFVFLMIVYAILKCRVKNEYIRKLEQDGENYMKKTDFSICLSQSRDQIHVRLWTQQKKLVQNNKQTTTTKKDETWFFKQWTLIKN